jgi:flagellar biosynthesis/type III secretory pathway protein FliH
MTYIHCAFAVGSPVRTLIENALQGRPRQMFISIADALIAKGRKQGRRAGLSEGRRAGLSEGRRAGLSEGLARAVLGVLEHRFSSVPAEVRRRVVSSQDERQLARWLERALTVGSAAELLEDDG